MTSVYKHTFPDGKVYIGITDNPTQRWEYGHGYQENEEMYAAILASGWKNIQHAILAKCDTRGEAEQLEREYILLYDSEDPEKGYNRTSIKAELLKRAGLAELKGQGRKPRQSKEMMDTRDSVHTLLLASGQLINGEGPECIEVLPTNNQKHRILFKGQPFGVYHYKTAELELSVPPMIPLKRPELSNPVVIRNPAGGWRAHPETRDEILQIYRSKV